jgi:hypothetical protein
MEHIDIREKENIFERMNSTLIASAMNSTTLATDENSNVTDNSNNILWTAILTFGLIFFTVMPFCYSKRRRKLCMRRIRERRWIEDERMTNQWYIEAQSVRQEERRRQLEEQQRSFERTRTQEDEIREQFLREKMKNYTIVSFIQFGFSRHIVLQNLIHRFFFILQRLSESDLVEESESQVETMTFDKISRESEDHTQGMDSMEHSLRGDLSDIDEEAPSKVKEESNPVSENNNEADFRYFQEKNGAVCIPAPGKETTSEKNRDVPNGCTICLCQFTTEECVTWSANKNCRHVFHHDCLVHWFLAVGQKVQAKRYLRNPEIGEDEALAAICQFPTLCPCCRQDFFVQSETISDI